MLSVEERRQTIKCLQHLHDKSLKLPILHFSDHYASFCQTSFIGIYVDYLFYSLELQMSPPTLTHIQGHSPLLLSLLLHLCL